MSKNFNLTANLYEAVYGGVNKHPHQIPFKKSYVCIGHNCTHKLAQLSGSQILFLHYLTDIMNKEQRIVSSIQLLKDFNQHLYVCRVKKSFSKSFYEKTIAKLVKLDLLISMDVGHAYIVNPKYIFREDNTYRKVLLRKLLKCINLPSWQKTNVFSVLGSLCDYRMP